MHVIIYCFCIQAVCELYIWFNCWTFYCGNVLNVLCNWGTRRQISLHRNSKVVLQSIHAKSTLLCLKSPLFFERRPLQFIHSKAINSTDYPQRIKPDNNSSWFCPAHSKWNYTFVPSRIWPRMTPSGHSLIPVTCASRARIANVRLGHVWVGRQHPRCFPPQ